MIDLIELSLSLYGFAGVIEKFEGHERFGIVGTISIELPWPAR
jgi:hypothetical protein